MSETPAVSSTPDRVKRRPQHRANEDASPLEDDMVVELESEAAAYQYLDMLNATLIPQL